MVWFVKMKTSNFIYMNIFAGEKKKLKTIRNNVKIEIWNACSVAAENGFKLRTSKTVSYTNTVDRSRRERER